MLVGNLEVTEPFGMLPKRYFTAKIPGASPQLQNGDNHLNIMSNSSLSGLGEKKYTGKFAEQGTKDSGFASDGPYHCEDCIHQDKARCYHPAVMNDPDLPDMPDGMPAEERKQKDGSILVDLERECCRFVNQPAREDEDED